ncbi:hypothetical protein I7I51_00976, partial [Histoplasma capsulatum]
VDTAKVLVSSYLCSQKGLGCVGRKAEQGHRLGVLTGCFSLGNAVRHCSSGILEDAPPLLAGIGLRPRFEPLLRQRREERRREAKKRRLGAVLCAVLCAAVLSLVAMLVYKSRPREAAHRRLNLGCHNERLMQPVNTVVEMKGPRNISITIRLKRFLPGGNQSLAAYPHRRHSSGQGILACVQSAPDERLGR